MLNTQHIVMGAQEVSLLVVDACLQNAISAYFRLILGMAVAAVILLIGSHSLRRMCG